MKRIIGEIRRFFGLDLPAREIPLKFSLPSATGKFKPKNPGILYRDLDEAKENLHEYFKSLMAEIKHFNRSAMNPSERLALTREMLKHFYPVAVKQILKQAKFGAVPEPEERKEILNAIMEIAQIMMVSYQTIFAGYYQGSNYQYVRVRDTVLESASRIFEMLILKQQAKALRYQLLAEQDWQIANTLFCVMSEYEDVEQPVTTLKKELGMGSSESLRDLFTRLHMVAKFDMLRWPTHLHWVIESYLNKVKNAVTVKVEKEKFKLGRYDLIAYCYSDKPANAKPLEKPPGAALILTCSNLFEAIRKDCLGLVQAKRNNTNAAIPQRLAHFPETEHFVISNQLFIGMEASQDDVRVGKEVKLDDLRIFVGFSEVFSLLRHQQGRFRSEERLQDILAKRSAVMAEDHTATEKSVWSMLYQDNKMIRLSTQETKYTTAMSIGSLLAYGVGEDINRPRLAVVSRIYRPSLKVVVVDVQRIANYSEAVTITINPTEDKSSKQNQSKPAVIVHDKERMGDWELIISPQEILLGFDKIVMSRNDKELPVNLENMRNATNNFYLFSTTLESKQLGIEGEPAYVVAADSQAQSTGRLI